MPTIGFADSCCSHHHHRHHHSVCVRVNTCTIQQRQRHSITIISHNCSSTHTATKQYSYSCACVSVKHSVEYHRTIPSARSRSQNSCGIKDNRIKLEMQVKWRQNAFCTICIQFQGRKNSLEFLHHFGLCVRVRAHKLLYYLENWHCLVFNWMSQRWKFSSITILMKFHFAEEREREIVLFFLPASLLLLSISVPFVLLLIPFSIRRFKIRFHKIRRILISVEISKVLEKNQIHRLRPNISTI